MRPWWIVLMLIGVAFGCQRDPHAEVQVISIEGVVDSAEVSTLTFSSGSQERETEELEGVPHGDTLVVRNERSHEVVVRVTDASGQVLGIGSAAIDFSLSPVSVQTIELGADCSQTGSDGQRCENDGGVAFCTAGACAESTCGDGIRSSTEACDGGNENANDDCHECSTTIFEATSMMGESVRDGSEILLDSPQNLLIDRAGVLYVSSPGTHRVYRRDLEGNISVVMGTGQCGLEGNDGPAFLAAICQLTAAAPASRSKVIRRQSLSRISKTSSPLSSRPPFCE